MWSNYVKVTQVIDVEADIVTRFSYSFLVKGFQWDQAASPMLS